MPARSKRSMGRREATAHIPVRFKLILKLPPLPSVGDNVTVPPMNGWPGVYASNVPDSCWVAPVNATPLSITNNMSIDQVLVVCLCNVG